MVTLSIAATVGFSTILTGFPLNHVLAESKLDELNEKKGEIESQKVGIETELDETQDKLDKINIEKDRVTAEISRLNLAIGDTETKITEKNNEINSKNTEISQLRDEVEALTRRIETRNELLKDRARAYQETGGVVSYLEVLVGAQSFGDFIDRVGAVAVIMEADSTLIKEHNEDKASLEEKQTQVEMELRDLEVSKQELQTLQSNLDVQIEDKNNFMAVLEQEEQEAENLQVSLQEEQDILAGQAAAIKKAIQMEQQRQAELQRQREAEAAAAAENTTDSSSSAPPVENVQNTAPVSSGNFTRPSAGYVSSGFGYRSFNGGGMHYGVDIAKSGSVPIVAAADGVIFESYTSASYGETIMITHYIDGKLYTTVYAHMSERLLGNQATVSKGQIIGYMGNTGDSYGQHLHFELHRGEWNTGKTNAINPAGIVPL